MATRRIDPRARALEAKHDVELPADYARFLAAHDPATVYEEKRGGRNSFELRGLAGRRGLAAPFSMNRWKSVPFFRAMTHVVRMLREVGALDAALEELSEEELLGSLCIGEENGDLVFIDIAGSGAVYLFHHDGADCERLASSFGAWLSRLRPRAEDD